MGRALALAYARDGSDLVLLGRDSARLEAAAQDCREAGAAEVTTHVADVRDREAMARLVEQQEPGVRVIAHGVPDRIIVAASRQRQLALCGLDADGIAARVRALHESEALAG